MEQNRRHRRGRRRPPWWPSPLPGPALWHGSSRVLLLLLVLYLPGALSNQVLGHRFGRHSRRHQHEQVSAANHRASLTSSPTFKPQVPSELPSGADRQLPNSSDSDANGVQQLRPTHLSDSSAATTATTTQRADELNLDLDFDQSQLDQQAPPNNALYKPAPSTNLDRVASDVIGRFRLRPATIIKAKESLDSGAAFLNYTIVTRLSACLIECWITDACDTAIYQESAVDLGSSSWSKRAMMAPTEEGFYLCYLFQCFSRLDGDQKCQFTAHNHYTSSSLRHPRASVTSAHCKANQFTCRAGDCIPERLVCDGVDHCSDRSDELDCVTKDRRSQGEPEVKYSRVVGTNTMSFRAAKGWHDSPLASIRFGHEEPEDFERGGPNSAIIATLLGFGATGIIVFIVGHKMKSIRARMASRARRRSLVPDVDYLLSTIPST